jgi:hypothetical protein
VVLLGVRPAPPRPPCQPGPEPPPPHPPPPDPEDSPAVPHARPLAPRPPCHIPSRPLPVLEWVEGRPNTALLGGGGGGSGVLSLTASPACLATPPLVRAAGWTAARTTTAWRDGAHGMARNTRRAACPCISLPMLMAYSTAHVGRSLASHTAQRTPLAGRVRLRPRARACAGHPHTHARPCFAGALHQPRGARRRLVQLSRSGRRFARLSGHSCVAACSAAGGGGGGGGASGPSGRLGRRRALPSAPALSRLL